jgi:hypothetical protein
VELADLYQIGMPQADLSQSGSKLCNVNSLSDESNRSVVIESKDEDLTSSRLATWIS